jgi:SRSO17 transposase
LGRGRARDDLRVHVIDVFDDPVAVLVDETGEVKKGTHSVRVPGQYTCTARQVENAQVASRCSSPTQPSGGTL